MTLEEIFLKYSADKLEQLSGRIEDCLGKLTDEQIWLRQTENENAVGNLVLHLCGNVRQWIGTGVAGQADVRDRDAEFAARGSLTGAQLRVRLKETAGETSQIIRNLPVARLPEPKTIQGYDVTVFEAIYHVLEHFSHHTGQILFATKLLTGKDLGYYRHLSHAKHFETTP